MDNSNSVTLKGFTITKETLKERFDIDLDDGEFYHFKNEIERSWEAREFALESVIVNHIKNSLEKLDYKLELEGTKLVYRKK